MKIKPSILVALIGAAAVIIAAIIPHIEAWISPGGKFIYELGERIQEGIKLDIHSKDNCRTWLNSCSTFLAKSKYKEEFLRIQNRFEESGKPNRPSPEDIRLTLRDLGEIRTAESRDGGLIQSLSANGILGVLGGFAFGMLTWHGFCQFSNRYRETARDQNPSRGESRDAEKKSVSNIATN